MKSLKVIFLFTGIIENSYEFDIAPQWKAFPADIPEIFETTDRPKILDGLKRYVAILTLVIRLKDQILDGVMTENLIVNINTLCPNQNNVVHQESTFSGL